MAEDERQNWALNGRLHSQVTSHDATFDENLPIIEITEIN
jgi:hypothetical protein